MQVFECRHQDQLILVDRERGRGIYECPRCPLVEWWECAGCHRVNIHFPSVGRFCKECSGRFVEVWYATDLVPILNPTAEKAIAARQSISIQAWKRAHQIRERVRRRLGLPPTAKVPRRIEDIAARILRTGGCSFDGSRWWLPNSVALSC